MELSVEDPEIGLVKFYLKQWGLNGVPGITFEEVKTKPCKPADFDENSQFYPLSQFSQDDFDTYSKKMKCVDQDSTNIFGSYNTDKASNLMIVFEKCNKTETVCKDDEIIDEWLEFKYIVTLEN